ncbi:MAG TPA: hypothetical protein DCL80_05340 [Balneola sp.]|nr:hypothetical protein [Balneola sp.]MAO78521.1 hypothetical protein [Balneola sp.]MBF64886.1 hypothetical protein [Balneola sp.]HAH50711.1 hypothetical protein [Balneola sp.]HBZ38299.1 hypothetical protein [Balneola sp.]
MQFLSTIEASRKNQANPLKVTHRHINIFFLFSLIFVFFIFGEVDDHVRIGIAVLLAALFGVTAFLLNWLTYDGALAAAIFGVISFGIGDWQVAAIVLFFFISASLLSKDVMATEDARSIKFRRDGRQVWANGFWLCLWILIWFISENPIFLAASVTSIVAATADTWATELGNRPNTKAYLITTLKEVSAGTDGGISYKGSLSALMGSVILSTLCWVMFSEISLLVCIIIGATGFLGCFVDSFLGVKLQGSSLKIPFLSNNETGTITVSNNIVNWLSTGTASLLVLLTTLII